MADRILDNKPSEEVGSVDVLGGWEDSDSSSDGKAKVCIHAANSFTGVWTEFRSLIASSEEASPEPIDGFCLLLCQNSHAAGALAEQ